MDVHVFLWVSKPSCCIHGGVIACFAHSRCLANWLFICRWGYDARPARFPDSIGWCDNEDDQRDVDASVGRQHSQLPRPLNPWVTLCWQWDSAGVPVDGSKPHNHWLGKWGMCPIRVSMRDYSVKGDRTKHEAMCKLPNSCLNH